MSRELRKNTAVRITVGPFSDKTDGVTPETALTVTSCKLTFVCDVAGVPTVILDAFATASGGSNDMVHITGDDAGLYDLELTAANLNYLGPAILTISDAATHCPVKHELMLLSQSAYDTKYVDPVGTGTADSGTPMSLVDSERTEVDTNYWNGSVIEFLNGNVAGQHGIVTGFNTGTSTLTFFPATTQAIAVGIKYQLYPARSVVAAIDATVLAAMATSIADQVWDELLAGHLGAGATGTALNGAASAGDPWGTTIPGAYGAGTAGKILGDNVNATIGSRASQTSVDDLPTNAELVTALGTADDAIIAAIAALPTANALATAQAAITAIKAKTDPMTYTTANLLDVRVNNVAGIILDPSSGAGGQGVGGA